MIKQFQGEYRWLSNFMPVKIKLDNRVYPSVEHAFHAAKSNDKDWKDYCTQHTAGYIKQQSRKVQLIKNWSALRISRMELCLRAKFYQEPFKQLLLDTGTQEIQEGNNWNDTFWGVNLKTGVGQNQLGKLIMLVRSELQYEDYSY